MESGCILSHLEQYVAITSTLVVTEPEYNLGLLASLSKKERSKVGMLVEIQEISPESLHRSLIRVFSTDTVTSMRRAFLNFKLSPHHNKVSDILNEMSRLARFGNFSNADVMSNFCHVVPEVIRPIIRIELSTYARKMGGQALSAEHILCALTANLEYYDRVISGKSKERKVFKVEERPFCRRCNLPGHFDTQCMASMACLLCDGQHREPLCQVYPSSVPQAKSCTYCLSVLGKSLYHDISRCVHLSAVVKSPPPSAAKI